MEIIAVEHNSEKVRFIVLWIPTFIVIGGSKVDSAFHPSEVDKMSTRNFWELSAKK